MFGERVFIGFNNYSNLLQKKEFYTALVLNIDFKGNQILQTIILFPYFVPVIFVIFGWQFIFDSVNGIYNYWVVNLFKLTSERRNILGDSETSMLVIVLFSVWKYYLITYLMILAKLKSIDNSQYEAASIDGANKWEKFKVVIFPEIKFTLGTVILLRFVWNLNRFEDVYLISPDTNILSVFTYKQAFAGIPDQGLAATISIVQLIIIGILIWFYVKKVIKW